MELSKKDKKFRRKWQFLCHMREIEKKEKELKAAEPFQI
jgi:hypothetical protein